MGKVWDGGKDGATALLEDRGDGPEDGSSTGSDHGDGMALRMLAAVDPMSKGELPLVHVRCKLPYQRYRRL